MVKKALYLLSLCQGRTTRNYPEREAALALLQLSSDLPVAAFPAQGIPAI